MNDKINPRHYREHPSGIEVIEIAEILNFCVGNAVKYVLRAGNKEGEDYTTDLEKAIWYLERAIHDESLGFSHFKMHLKSTPRTLNMTRFEYLKSLIQKYVKYEHRGGFKYYFLSYLAIGDLELCLTCVRGEVARVKSI